jgi:Ca2+-binding EF-hand superfamily protein
VSDTIAPGLAGRPRRIAVQFRRFGRSTPFRERSMKTIKSLSKAALTLGFALLAATGAYAQSTDIWTTNFQKAFMTEKMMHMMDMSGKGMVTRDDYNKYMSKVFDMMDKKHNGMVDKDEFMAMDTSPASTNIYTTDFQKTFRTEAMMHMIDKSGKGMVSKADFMTHMNKIFDMLDKDHNGMLEANEFIYEKAFGVK